MNQNVLPRIKVKPRIKRTKNKTKTKKTKIKKNPQNHGGLFYYILQLLFLYVKVNV